jgi:uncharacterized repeat protein (TIGR01451 family)
MPPVPEKKRQPLDFERLEPRILYDADLLIAAEGDAAAELGHKLLAHDSHSHDVDRQEPTKLLSDPAPVAEGSEAGAADPAIPSASLRHEILFVDGAIPDAQALAQGMAASAPAGVELSIVMIDPDRDGFAQILEALEGMDEPVDGLHIVSHSTAGTLHLGSTNYTADTLGGAESWRPYLTQDADILLYGCNLAGNAGGVELIQRLADVTAADIAASTDDTGAAAAGGDWDLEQSTGPIESLVLHDDAFAGVLPIDGFGDFDHNGDGLADPLRMITWNVIGLDSNNPEGSGPDTFMVGLRVESDALGLTGLTVRIVDMDGIDVFGNGVLIGDGTIVYSQDFDDGVDNIRFINTTEYTGETIAPGSYRDYYFNVDVLRLKESITQIQPFRFEVFEDANGNGVWDPGENGRILDKFSWIPDAAAANTPLYLFVESYISQARNHIRDQTYPTQPTASDDYAAIRIEGYTVGGVYPDPTVTLFVGSTLNIRVEGETATSGYPQLTLSTVFDNTVFRILSTEQAYAVPITVLTYQQDLGTGTEPDGEFSTLEGDVNTSIYANAAGWNPATHGLMITTNPPKAGGGPIVTDYTVQVTGTGSGQLQTLILDYSGSSFHYNADMDGGVAGIQFVYFNAVTGSILGTVKEDTDGDSVGNVGIAGVTVTLTGMYDSDFDGVNDTVLAPMTTTTDAQGRYAFNGLLPGAYTVDEGVAAGYGDIGDSDGPANGLSTVYVVISKDPLVATAGELGFTGVNGMTADTLLGYAMADFVEGKADLTLAKTADTLYPQLGGNVVFTVTVTNTGPAVATGIEIKDYLPAGLTYLSDDGGAATTESGGVVTWTAGSLAAGATATLNITARVDSDAPLTNFAEITASGVLDPDSIPNNDGGARIADEDDEASLTVESQQADLSLIKTVSDSTPAVGDTITFTLLLTNTGPDDATNVVVTDPLASNLIFVSATSPTLHGTYNDVTGVWTVGTVAAGVTARLTISATVDPGVPQPAFSNFAEVTAADQFDPDSAPGNDGGARTADEDDEAIVTVTPKTADLSLAKIVDNAAPDVGGSITFTLILTNAGTQTAYDVQVSDLLPASLTFVSATPSTGSYNSGTGIWDVPSVAPGQTVTCAITANVTDSSPISNVAYVARSLDSGGLDLPDPDSVAGANTGTDDWSDGDPDDDEASVTVTPGATDLALFKSVDNASPTLGTNITFTLTVVNAGPKNAYNVQVKDYLPAGLTFVSATPSQGSASNSAGTVTWDAGTVLSGASATLTIVATATGTTSVNFAQITEMDRDPTDLLNGVSTLNDPDSTPNNNAGPTPTEDDEAAITIIAGGYADLQLSQTVTDPTPGFSGSSSFIVTITNAGTATATNILVRDYLSQWDANGNDILRIDAITVTKGTANLTAPPALTVAGLGDLDWTIASLAYGESATLTIDFTTNGNSGATTNRFNDDVPNYVQVVLVDQPDPDSIKNNGVYPTPNEDDESVAWIFSPSSTRVDVALDITSVTFTDSLGNPKSLGSNLVAGDLVTIDVTVMNQAGNINEPYVFVSWPAGLDLTSVSFFTGEGATLEYTTNTAPTFTWSTTSTANPTYLRWQVLNNTTSAGFAGGTNEVLTLNAVVNAAGDAADLATLNAWWTNTTTSNQADSDSSVPNQFDDPTNNDLLTDDLTDGVADDDEDSVSIGSNQSADLSLAKEVSLDGGQTYATTATVGDEQRVTFRLTLSNDVASVNAATNIQVTDLLPTGVVFEYFYGGGSYNSTTGVWSISSLGKGQSVEGYIVARVDWDLVVPSTINNYAEITLADQNDPDSTRGNSSTTEDDDATVTLTEKVSTADLSLMKSVNNASPVVGDNVVFTLTLVNGGNSTATAVTVRDSLPAGMTWISDTGGGAYDPGTGVWTVASLASGALAQLQITARVDTAGAKVNFAEVTASSLPDPDSTPGNGNGVTPQEDDEAAVTLTPVAADLSLTKGVDIAEPNVGDILTFTVTVVNSGPNTAYNVVVEDSLPSASVLGSITLVSSTVNGAAQGSFNTATGVWTIGTLPVGVATLTFTGQVLSAAAFSNYAQIVEMDKLVGDAIDGVSTLQDPDSTPNNNPGPTPTEDDEASVSVTPQAADLSLSKTVSDATPSVGATVTFTLTVINAGLKDATNVVVTDQLPAGLGSVTFVSSKVNGVDQGSFNTGTGVWTIGTVPVGNVAVLTFTAVVNTAAPFVNFAQVTGVDQADPDSTKNNDVGQTADEDDEAAVTIDARQADLSLTKSVDNAAPNVGDRVTFTITIANGGPDDATGVAVKDLLPAGLTYESDDSGGVYNPVTGVWSVGTVGNGLSRSLKIIATVTSASPVVNYAQVSASDLFDPDSTPNDNSVGADDDASVTVDAREADLSLAKTVSVVDLLTTNGYFEATWTLTLTSAVTSDQATGVQVEDLLPSTLTFVSYSGDGTYNLATGTWSVGTVDPGATKTLTLVTRFSTGAAITNYAQVVASSLPDPDSTPNNNAGPVPVQDDEAAATVDRTVIDLSLEKRAEVWDGTKWINAESPAAAPFLVPGGTIRYVLTLSNARLMDTATGINVRELLPAGVDPASLVVTGDVGGVFGGGVWTLDGGPETYDPATGIWNVGTLASGDDEKLVLTGTITDVNQLSNQAEVIAANQPDRDSDPASSFGTDDYGDGKLDDDEAVVRPGIASIYGRVLDDHEGFDGGQFDAGDAGIGGVTVDLYKDADGDGTFETFVATTLTDVNGVYFFYVAADGFAYAVIETDPVGLLSVRDLHYIDPVTFLPVGDTTAPGWNINPIDHDPSTPAIDPIQPGAEYYDKNFLDLTPFSISGSVLTDNGGTVGDFDAGDTGVAGVTVELFMAGADNAFGTADDVLVATTATAPDGSYAFTGLTSGAYQIRQTNLAGYLDVKDVDPATGQNIIRVNLLSDRDGDPSNDNKTGQNFLDTYPPVVDLNVADAGTFNYSAAFPPGGSPVNVTNSDAAILDTDDVSMTAFSIVAGGLLDGPDEKILFGVETYALDADKTANVTFGGTTFTIAYVAATTTFTITKSGGGEMPVADLNLLMRGMTYQNTDATPTNGARTFTFSTHDGGNASNSPVATVTVGPPDLLPVAVADGGTAVEGGGVISGNVMTNDTQGDAPATVTQVVHNAVTYVLGGLPVTFGTAAGGFLTIRPDGSYDYTPPGSLGEGGLLTETFDYTIVDTDGDTSSSTLTIAVDRLPAASSDANAAVEGGGAVIGNVITNDDEGNVSAAVTAADQGGSPITIGTPFATAAGGTLTLNSGGSYSYTPPASLPEGGVLTEVFSYTITDADGDTSSSTLSITVDRLPAAIADANAAVEGGPAVSGNVITNDDEGNVSATVTAADQGGSPITIGTPFGTAAGGSLTLNAGGSYSYTPPTSLPEGGVLTEVFSYTIADADGDTSSSTLTIAVDRLPAASADANAAVEGGGAVIGNVITNDDEGNVSAAVTAADQGGSPITIGTPFVTAAGGSLTLNAGGSYSYTPPAVLPEGGVLTEVFSYTIADADGDTSSSTLSITVDRLPAAIADANAAVEGGGAVIGNVITNDDEGNVSAAVTAADQGGSPITIGTPFGTAAGGSLTLNAGGSYSYTPPAVLPEGGVLTEVFSYTIADADGDTSSSTLSIAVDRLPSASADANAAAEGGLAVSGNVITNDDEGNVSAAVTAASQGGSPITIGTPFVTAAGGTLTLNSGGSYSYTPPAVLPEGGVLTEVFSYTIADADGDTSSSTLSITVDRLPTAIPDLNAAVEGALAVGGNVITNDDEGNVSAAVTAADQGGSPITIGTPFATSAGGTLTLNSDGSYSYTPPASGLVPLAGLIEIFNYTITDADGDTSSSTLTITVSDENDLLPVANPDGGGTAEGAGPISGNVIDNDDEGNAPATVIAADQGGSPITIGTPFATSAGGTLTLNSDGSYTYAPPASLPEGGLLTETFDYTIADVDGDTSSSTLTITINRLPAASADANAAVEGGPAVSGNVITNDDEGNVSAAVTAADQGGSPITIGTAFTTTAGGTLTLNADGSYTYTPPASLPEGGVLTEVFSTTIADADGDTSSSTLSITVDRLPSASADVNAAVEGGPAVSGNVITNDDEGNVSAAVTAADQGGSPITIGTPFATAAGGTLTLNSDGSYSYAPPADGLVPSGGIVEVFNYTITDADGDTSSSTLTITVDDQPLVTGPMTPDEREAQNTVSSEADPFWYRIESPLIRPAPVLPLMPVFSGYGEPGATLVVTLVDKLGIEIGSQTVMVDAGGNWLATFASTIIYDEPHLVRVSLIAATYDESPDALYNMRTYFSPAIMRGFFSYENSNVSRAYSWSTAEWMGHLMAANENPLSLGRSISTYELIGRQPTPSGY